MTPETRAAAAVTAAVFAGIGIAACLAAGSGASPRGGTPAVERMLRPLVEARSATARVILERSDPFGGPPERTSGRLWYQPGRGLRVRFERGGGEEIVADHARGELLLYRPAEKTIYRAPWERTPARLRRIVEEPSRLLESDLHARPERLAVLGSLREGQRLHQAALGDSTAALSLWIGPDTRTGLLRWIAITAPEDTVWIELRGLALRGTASDRDLVLSAPRGTPVEPLDPRELLPRAEPR